MKYAAILLWRNCFLRFMTSLLTFLWTLLFLIPSIVASYLYALTPYLMTEGADLGVVEAINCSKELMDGNKWRLFCLRRTQELERQRGILYGVILVVLGIVGNAMAGTTGGSEVQNFISGLLMGLSVAEILAGVVMIGKNILKK